jgi:hypothetical protein
MAVTQRSGCILCNRTRGKHTISAVLWTNEQQQLLQQQYLIQDSCLWVVLQAAAVTLLAASSAVTLHGLPHHVSHASLQLLGQRCLPNTLRQHVFLSPRIGHICVPGNCLATLLHVQLAGKAA